MRISSAVGKPADPSILVNVPKLITAYYELRHDPSDPRQRVVFGASGHRGSATVVAFNEWHILAITQAICDYRKLQNVDGPLFLGMDTRALIAEHGWFAARPSGTEEIYKIYAGSFLGQDHLRQIKEEAQTIVSETLARSTPAV